MRSWRHVFVVVLLLLAQAGALTHALEHLRPDADTPASHPCALCLAAHGLDVPLASTPPRPLMPAAVHARPCRAAFLATSPAAPAACARAPPVA